MYDPYFYSYPYIQTNQSIFSRLFNSIDFKTILSGTQKTLNIINQTIPLIKQATPIINNAKTMFKVMNEFKKIDSQNETLENNPVKTPVEAVVTSNEPTFFI